MGGLGTLSWMQRTGGKLAWRDRLVIVAQSVAARARTKKRLQMGLKVRSIEVDAIIPPDSAVTREAIAICQDASSPFLFNHCLRAYFWARLLDNGSQSFDDEAVFTALMLHDLGLTDRHRLPSSTENCFTQAGSGATVALALKHGWSDKRATIAAEAITLHLNVVVRASHSKEAQLVRAGSGADVAGLGLDVLHPDQIQSVVMRYPRRNMKAEFLNVLSVEAKEHPHCRAAFLMNKLGFAQLMRSTSHFSE